MKKRAEAFRSIGEVAKLIGVAPHVLRYWETQFSQLKPMKRPDGRRYYRPEDVLLAAGLCEVLREEGLTIRGAKKILSKDRGEAVRARGAARLNDALGADLPEDEGEAPTSGAAPAQQPTAQDSSAAPRLEPILQDGGTDQPVNADEQEMMANQAPKSRHRKRRTIQGDGALPLFPELDIKAPQLGIWLAQLVLTSAALRETPSLPPAAIAQAGRLRDALVRLS